MNSLKFIRQFALVLLALSFLWAFNRVDVQAADNYSAGYTTARSGVNFRTGPGTEYNIIDTLELNTSVAYIDNGSNWYTVIFEDQTGYISKNYVADEQVDTTVESVSSSIWNGPKLTSFSGICYGPSGKETYYNMNMSQVVTNLKNNGYSGDYWVRSDGVKMYGNYVMTAARYADHPYGSIVATSLGDAIVCDTGGFATYNSGVALDIAVTW